DLASGNWVPHPELTWDQEARDGIIFAGQSKEEVVPFVLPVDTAKMHFKIEIKIYPAKGEKWKPQLLSLVVDTSRFVSASVADADSFQSSESPKTPDTAQTAASDTQQKLDHGDNGARDVQRDPTRGEVRSNQDSTSRDDPSGRTNSNDQRERETVTSNDSRSTE